MPQVRNGQYINIDESSSDSLHIPNNQVIETKMPMHNHLPRHQSPDQTAQQSSAAKSANQFGSPSIQHQPSGSQPAIQQTPLTKAELRKVNQPKSVYQLLSFLFLVSKWNPMDLIWNSRNSNQFLSKIKCR